MPSSRISKPDMRSELCWCVWTRSASTPGTAAASRIGAILTKFGRAPAAHKSLRGLPGGANPAISRKGSVGEPRGPAGAPGRGTADCVRSSFTEFRRAELGEGFAPPWTPAGQRATARAPSPRPRWGRRLRLHACGSSRDEWLDLQVAVAGERLEVSVIVQDRCTLTDRDGRDQAVDESSNRLAFPSAGAVQVGGLLEVGQPPQSQQGKWEQASAQLRVLSGSTGAGQQLHDDGLRRPDRRAPREMVLEGSVGPPGAGPQELDPGRRIDEDHRLATRLRRIASRSPFQPAPSSSSLSPWTSGSRIRP